MQRKPTLIIFSGLPGSGKTTLASKLASYLSATYLRIDTIDVGLQGGAKVPELGEKCYRVAQLIAQENLRLGNSVIGDAVNPWELTRNAWNEIASSAQVRSVHIEIVCSEKAEHKTRLETRTTTLEGLKDPTWQEVQERDYHPWERDRIRLGTAGKTVLESFEELLQVLNQKLEHTP